jgi:hypothetical protein
MKIKIYKIVNNKDDRVYIGSTKQPLYKRWNNHKNRWRKKDLPQYMSSVLFDFCGYENCCIILEAEVDVENIEYARKVEREYIDKYESSCVNKYLPYKTEQEILTDKTQYKKNRDLIIKTDEFKQGRNMRQCCVLCKKELSISCVGRHYKLLHK